MNNDVPTYMYGRNHDGVIARREIVSHHLQEEKPMESFPQYSLTNSFGMMPEICGNVSHSGSTFFFDPPSL